MSKQATKALIDANITANGTQAITGPILNNVLNTMVDDYGTQEELSQLAQRVAIETGICDENGLYFVDDNLYIGAFIDSSGFTAINSLSAIDI